MGTLGAARTGQGEYSLLDWGVAHRAKPGEAETGDHYIVRPTPERTLVAVVDGLGHGAEAAAAASTTVSLLREAGADEPLSALMKRCHAALQRTRGVVMGLATFKRGDNGMQWLGIGNIEGVILRVHSATRPRVHLLLSRGGVVGHLLPALVASTVPLDHADMMVLATDGIRTDFADRLSLGERPQAMADRILAQFAKESDDALVLVARYLGHSP
jgi:serine/threonine protein phosphatase PrpC